MPTPKIVSINPSSFRDDSLADMSLEGVVSRLKVEERMRRDINEDPRERPIAVHFRTRPAGLELSIDELHESLEVGAQILTRCMCRQAESWFNSLELVKTIVPVYRIIRNASDGHIDIEQQLKRGNNFNFITNIPVGNSGNTSYSSVGWVRDFFSELADPLGVPSYRLFLLGLVWSVTTCTSGQRSKSIAQYLQPEVLRFKQHLQERLLQLQYFSNVMSIRPQ